VGRLLASAGGAEPQGSLLHQGLVGGGYGTDKARWKTLWQAREEGFFFTAGANVTGPPENLFFLLLFRFLLT
jgi:hypothetical protein